MALGAMLCYALVITTPYAESLSNSLLRLHILAESDSKEDQNIKYDVRNFVSEQLSNTEFTSLSDYTAKAESLANARLDALGVPYDAEATVEHIYIPKKTYKNITLPSGRYNALRLKLGKGEGENWWCVAYPSLCFTEDFSGKLSQKGEEKLAENLSQEELELIKNEPKIKFFVVDLAGKIRELLM